MLRFKKPLYIPLLLISAFLILTYLLTHHSPLSSFSRHPLSPLRTPHPKYAYATFLASRAPSSSSSSSQDQEDPYFISVRLLTYQLLHSPHTRTRLSPPIPLLILTLPDVPAHQISTLAAEGATIVPIQPLTLPDTVFRQNQSSSVPRSRFRDVLAKLRLWQLTPYDKVLALDADTILLHNLDDIFDDPVLSKPMRTLPANNDDMEPPPPPPPPPLPSTYLLSASADTWGPQADWNSPTQPSFLCACFMLLRPSARLFAYYEWILARPDASFAAAFPDQDLLIYTHAPERRMPWRRISVEWSVNDGEMVSVDGELAGVNDGREGAGEVVGGGGGVMVKSLHVKGWRGAEGGNVGGEKVVKLWEGLVWEMKKYYQNGDSGVRGVH